VLTGHVAVWLSAIVLVGLASPLVRAYAGLLERRTLARTEGALRRLREAENPVTIRHDDVAGSRRA
jgi:hypothetical protein